MADVIKQKSNLLLTLLNKNTVPDNKKVEGAVKLLLTTLDEGIKRCEAAKTKLDALAVKLSGIEGKMTGFAQRIKD